MYPSQKLQNFSLGGQKISVWVVLILFTAVVGQGSIQWIRAFHIVFGFSWWGMVFFLNFILLPAMKKMTQSTKYEVLGTVFPRIFKTATVSGFLTVSLGWIYALRFYAKGDFSYFYSSLVNILFTIGIVAITCLYLFHLILERNEIDTVLKALETEDDAAVNKLIAHLQLIPRVGFSIMTIGVALMFIH